MSNSEAVLLLSKKSHTPILLHTCNSGIRVQLLGSLQMLKDSSDSGGADKACASRIQEPWFGQCDGSKTPLVPGQ